MNAILTRLRRLFLPAAKANHALWGTVLYLIGSRVATLLGQPRAVAMFAGMALAGGLAVAWGALNHKVDPETPADPLNALAGLAGAFLGLLAGLPIR
jgi:hypothetical protein